MHQSFPGNSIHNERGCLGDGRKICSRIEGIWAVMIRRLAPAAEATPCLSWTSTSRRAGEWTVNAQSFSSMISSTPAATSETSLWSKSELCSYNSRREMPLVADVSKSCRGLCVPRIVSDCRVVIQMHQQVTRAPYIDMHSSLLLFTLQAPKPQSTFFHLLISLTLKCYLGPPQARLTKNRNAERWPLLFSGILMWCCFRCCGRSTPPPRNPLVKRTCCWLSYSCYPRTQASAGTYTASPSRTCHGTVIVNWRTQP